MDTHDIGPEVTKLWDRLESQGVVNFHVSAAPGATAEQVAAEINRVEAWLSVPANRLLSRLRGEAFLNRDTSRQRFRIDEDGQSWPIPRSPHQMQAERTADLLEEAAARVEQLSVLSDQPSPTEEKA